MDERREKPRWQISQAAEFTAENGVKPITCRVEDISSGGMCISLKRNLFDEVFLNFNLTLSEDFQFNLGAHVAWRELTDEKNIYGLTFNRIEESVRNKIGDYVKTKFPELLVKQWWS